MVAAIKYRCTECLASVAVTPMNKYRKHPPNSDDPCRMSGQQVPVRIIMGGADKGDDRPVKGRDYDECPGCSRMPKLDADGAFKEHAEAKGSEELCMFSGKLPNGKKPTPEIPGATQYAQKLQETAAEIRIPCPEDGCGRTPIVQPDGTLIAHMQEGWGQKPCPMSGQVMQSVSDGATPFNSAKPQESVSSPTLFPSEVFKNGEPTPQRPARMATLALPSTPNATAQAGGSGMSQGVQPLPEIKALADQFPRNARIPVSTPVAAAPPALAAAPVMANAAAEVLDGYRNAAATIQEAASQAAPNGASIPNAQQTECADTSCGYMEPHKHGFACDSTCSTCRGHYDAIRHTVANGAEPPIPYDRLRLVGHTCMGGTLPHSGPHDLDCVLTFEELPRLCANCKEPMGGFHECYGPPERPVFVRPDPAPFEIDWDRVGQGFVPAGDVPAPLRPLDMSTEAEQLVARMKEIFYAYSNRMDRSVQETLGPSEIGTPCDRRLAMSIMRIPSVNPGGDNWASFVGTCVHTGLAEMFLWADANQGRFAVEQRVEYPNALVPKGTADLLDRTLLMVDDHKLMGRWSLDKLRLEGIKPLYLVQLMLYAYGLILKGEKVKKVALLGWPREQATLNDLTAVVLPYDESIALDALRRVDEIDALIKRMQEGTSLAPLKIAKHFSVEDDCTYCPFFAKGDSEMTRGCNGRK